MLVGTRAHAATQKAQAQRPRRSAFSASISPMAQLSAICKDAQGDEDTLRALTAAYWYYRYALDATE